jgi:hypothetical protein
MTGPIGSIARLMAQLDEQKEKIRQLEEQLGFHLEAPLVLRLTPAQSAMFGCLYKRPLASRESMQQACETAIGCGRGAEIKTIDVHMVKLRKRLRPHGIEIRTVWGRGYQMPDDSKQVVRDLFIQEAAQQAAAAAIIMEHSNDRPRGRPARSAQQPHRIHTES